MPIRVWLGTCVVVWVSAVAAAEPETPLPEPLTLEYSLSLADAPHPDLAEASARVAAAAARRESAEAQDDYSILLNGRLRMMEGNATLGTTDDNYIGLTVTKPLFDFGLSDKREAAARLQEAGAGLQFMEVRQQRREAIMRRYFDVLLADIAFLRDNENMSVAYVTLDRLRARQKLGQVSAFDVLEQERLYQTVRKEYIETQAQQRITRARLAQELNRPGQLSANLATPKLPLVERKPPDLEALQQLAVANSPTLQALRKQEQAASASLVAMRASDGFTIEGEAGISNYSQLLGTRDIWRVGINFNMPLSKGGRTDAAIAQAQADLDQARSRLRAGEMKVRQAILETWLQIDTLRIEREEMQVLNDYRGFYLDRSRTLYEQEMKADLGDAMVKVTDAQYKLAATEFNITMAWTRLEGLTGVPVAQFPAAEKTE